MKIVNESTIVISGNLYTDMYLDWGLLSIDPSDITIHVKGDIIFGVLRKPNRMKTKDYYLVYEDFLKTHGQIYDIIAFSKI